MKNAVKHEKNYLACYYSILSWTDVVLARKRRLFEKYVFIQRMERTSRIRSSEHCQMACWNAMYLLGNKKALRNMVRFLQSENYQVRCATAKHLGELVNEKNKRLIVTILKKQYLREETIAVKSSINGVLEALNASV